MNRLLIIGLLFSCPLFGQHYTNTVTVEDLNVRKSDPDKWTCMDKGGCYASNGEWVLYSSMGYQFEIFTERADHHGRYQVEVFNVIGVENNDYILSLPFQIDTVNCNSSIFSKNKQTWQYYSNLQRNRAIKITCIDAQPVVIDKIKVWVDHNPLHKPIEGRDTIFNEVVVDSIIWNIQERDSLVLNLVQKDSTIWNITEIDSVIYNYDTLGYKSDTIIFDPEIYIEFWGLKFRVNKK